MSEFIDDDYIPVYGNELAELSAFFNANNDITITITDSKRIFLNPIEAKKLIKELKQSIKDFSSTLAEV